MSKVTKLEPVGYQWLDTCHFRKKIPKGCNVSEFRGIVTTFQAEAYAAAKVREALEEAARICDAQSKEWDSDSLITEKDYAEFCAVSIRALIK